MTSFVNPYSFVPQVGAPEGGAPAGHASMPEGRFSGVLDAVITARTPLLIGGFTPERREGAESPERQGLPKRIDGTVMIPGSGLVGAVRSVHEALTGGCLRVLDTDYVPVHRHTANPAVTKDLRLAVVTKVDDGTGRARRVRLCTDENTIQIQMNRLPGSEDDPSRTGDRLAWEGNTAERARTADIHRIGRLGPVKDKDAGWVLFVSDTNARTARRRARPDEDARDPVQFYAGLPGSTECEIPGSVWEAYLQTVDGADDLRKANLPGGAEPKWSPVPPDSEYADVFWPPQQGRGGRPGQKIGQRLLARRYLHEGQPIWVTVGADGKVSEIRLSRLWRYRGTHSVGERVGEAGPCTEPDQLCWSCRIFGSADTREREEDETARQHSYRGHVRVDDFVAQGTVTPVDWHLAPLSSPRPSAGQFYLDNAKAVRRTAKKDDPPAATWGSVADDPRDPRGIRGRKFYWRTRTEANTDPGHVQRGKARPQQRDRELSQKVTLIPAGTVFTGRVAFDNLDAADYGSLLAALDPRHLAEVGAGDWGDSVIGVGGGKPFGFGSVIVDVKRAKAESAAQRYLGASASSGRGDQVTSTDGDQAGAAADDGRRERLEAVRAFRDRMDRVAGDVVTKTWPALRNLLAFGFIADELVWYPPSTGEPGDEDYDKSFEFFSRTTGAMFKDKVRDLIDLPDAAGSAEEQVLDSAAGERRLPRQTEGGRRGR